MPSPSLPESELTNVAGGKKLSPIQREDNTHETPSGEHRAEGRDCASPCVDAEVYDRGRMGEEKGTEFAAISLRALGSVYLFHNITLAGFWFHRLVEGIYCGEIFWPLNVENVLTVKKVVFPKP